MSNTKERPTFHERCRRECTRDVIFLFQVRNVTWYATPEGYEWDSGDMRRLASNRNSLEDDPQELTDDDMLDRECAFESWRTECVFLTREDAERFGKRTDYRYRQGWRVFGVPAEGELAELIRGT